MHEKPVNEQILQYIQRRIGLSAFNSWFTQIEIVCSDIVMLYVSSQFIKDWIDSHYIDVVDDACKAICDTPYRIEVRKSDILSVKHKLIKGEMIDISMPLDERMTFQTFVVGPSNNIAFEAAKRVSIEPNVFNPLFIYGASGFGKTHLLQSTAWAACETNQKVCYISAEQYMMLFVKALKAQDIMSFKNIFRSVDLLIIDDFQFMGGKDSTQEEFFHSFMHLMSQGKQVVISADKSPRELSGIENRLRSRLGGGLPIQIHTASYELRLGILQEKVKLNNRNIDSSILELIAEKIVTSIRELEGALMRMWAQVDFFGAHLTREVAEVILSDMTAVTTNLFMRDIIYGVLDFYQLTELELLSSSRAQKIVVARQVAMMLCREITKKSLPEIAKFFGGHDHTKVLYSINKIKEKAKLKHTIAMDIEKIRSNLLKK